MTDQSWSEYLIQWGVWAVVMLAVMIWAGRKRLRAGDLKPGELRHLRGTLISGISGFLLFSGFVALSLAFPTKTGSWWTTTLFAGFTVASLFVVSAFFFETHRMTDDGLAFRNLFGVRKDLRWRDLKSVRYAHSTMWFRLETHGGTVARVSAKLKGLPEFARLLLHKAPREAIDRSTLPILQQTAGGYPPST